MVNLRACTLWSSDFHLFPKLKDFLWGNRFASDDELKETVYDWLNSLAATVYAEGIGKFVKHFEKSLNLNGDKVKKKSTYQKARK